MIKKLLFAASALGAMSGTFALTGPAHAGIFVCGQFQCEDRPDGAGDHGLYASGAVCWVGSGQKGQVDVSFLRACVEGVTGKTSVTMHVRAQGASGRGVTWWNGGLAVTQFAFGAQSPFPESGGILYYEVGRQPATAQKGDGWLLERPHNASFVATTATPTLDSVIVLAGGGGSKGRIRYSPDGSWPVTSAVAGRGGLATGRYEVGLCTTGNKPAVCDAGDPGGDHGDAGGGGGGGDLKGGAGGTTEANSNIPSEGGWGELYGPAAYGAQTDWDTYMMIGGEGGQGDGGGGGGGAVGGANVYFENNADIPKAGAGGGGGSRALRTSIQQNLPIFAEEPRVELVFNHWTPG